MVTSRHVTCDKSVYPGLEEFEDQWSVDSEDCLYVSEDSLASEWSDESNDDDFSDGTDDFKKGNFLKDFKKSTTRLIALMVSFQSFLM